MSGHAIEARLYAEDPAQGFLPSSGPLRWLTLPDDVRVDSAVERGDRVTPYYDSMIAKLIAKGKTRSDAVDVLEQACGRVCAWPVKTNAGFLARLLSDPSFVAGDVQTGFLGERPNLADKPEPEDWMVRSAADAWALQSVSPGDHSPWAKLRGFRVNASPQAVARVELDGRIYTAGHDASERSAARRAPVTMAHAGHWVVFDRGEAYDFTAPGVTVASEASVADGAVLSPMPGRIVAVAARAGGAVSKGTPLVTLEAMKMEHVLTAPFDGTVVEVTAEVGQQVSEGVLLARVEAGP
jgi:3-methylcrotonyl-CoA carboxylase alpha subunit